MLTLNDKVDQMDISDVYRALYPRASDYTFFSRAHKTFLRISCMLRHNTGINKFKKIEIILSIFSNHNAVK